MRFPRFRIRTLMIAVAAAGIECAIVVSFPPSFLILLPIGPLAAIVFSIDRPRVGRWPYFRHGVWGGVIQAVPLTLLLIGPSVHERALGISRIGNEWSFIAFQSGFVPLTSVGAGAIVGLFGELGDRLCSWLASCRHAGPVIPCDNWSDATSD